MQRQRQTYPNNCIVRGVILLCIVVPYHFVILFLSISFSYHATPLDRTPPVRTTPLQCIVYCCIILILATFWLVVVYTSI